MMRTITQTQIGAFERCRRFYYLKYIEKLAWPVESSVSAEIQRGADFHLLARQLIMGLEPAELIFPPDGGKMSRWIDDFRARIPLKDQDQLYAEKEVSAVHAGVLWLGLFDALAVKDDRLTVFDWKTTGHPAAPAEYLRSPQTKLYRFLAKMCAPRILGTGLHGIPAENIEMVYWFPEHPDAEIRLPYSESAFREDLTWLEYKAAEMSSQDTEDYPRTEKSRVCRFCKYETYCIPRSSFSSGDPLLPSENEAESPDNAEEIQPVLFFEDPADDNEPEAVSF